MACPNLQYRSSDGDREFDHERPYCTVTGSFVSPMRADICNDRYEFHHGTDCDVYRRAAERMADTSGASDAVPDSVD